MLIMSVLENALISGRIGRDKQHRDAWDYLVGLLRKKKKKGEKASQTQIREGRGQREESGTVQNCRLSALECYTGHLGPVITGSHGELLGHSEGVP